MKRAHPPASRLDLTDLAALRDQLKHETEQREAERQRAEAAARQAEAEADLFRASIGEVSALRQGKRVEHPRTPPAPQPVHSRAEEQRYCESQCNRYVGLAEQACEERREHAICANSRTSQ